MGRRESALLLCVLGLAIAAILGLQSGVLLGVSDPGGYEEGTVTVYNGSTDRGTVSVRISDNRSQRITGLSDTESLDRDEGMLFVHNREDTHTYVMRDMDFPIDIIFIDSNRTITTIHHAPTPPEGETYSREYPGKGLYVLEVNRGWVNATGTVVGDRVELPDTVTATPAE
jgi:uncharacterized membrane protein (UPF0127 family)